MKLNERMKRRLAVLGCVVVGAVLIAAIGSNSEERHREAIRRRHGQNRQKR